MLRAGDRKVQRPRDRASIDAEQSYALRLPGFLHDHGVQPINPTYELRQLLQHRIWFVELGVNGCGRTEPLNPQLPKLGVI